MMMNPNILNQNPLMFFDRAVNAQRSQLLTVMADAVSECRTAADQAAELNETGQVGLLRLAEVWSAIRAKEGMGGLVLEGTEAKILSDVVAQFYAYLSGCMFNDPVGMAIYAELHYTVHHRGDGNSGQPDQPAGAAADRRYRPKCRARSQPRKEQTR